MSSKPRRATRTDHATAKRPARGGVLPSDKYLPTPRAIPALRPIEGMTDAQDALINALDVYEIIFATGEFGTGKTYVPVAKWCEAYQAGDTEKLYITRPNVGCDEEYGFLPGDLSEKVAPWAAPVVQVLNERLGAGHVDYLIKAGVIEIAPLGMLRGLTMKNCWAILDEAQNATPKQMKLFLSRIGENAKFIIDGDLEQKDIPGQSGLEDGLNRMSGHHCVGHVHFEIDDIVRSGIARDVCIAYSNNGSPFDLTTRRLQPV